MQQLHVLNLGYPKCGTTWLWINLIKANCFDDVCKVKENHALLNSVTVPDYVSQYQQGKITANFSVHNFSLDRYVIDQLSCYNQIRCSIILRDPLDLVWSYYNFTQCTVDFNDYCKDLFDQGWFLSKSKIIKRWQQSFKDRFFVFYYDDLVKDQTAFLKNYAATVFDNASVDISYTRPLNVTDFGQKEMPQLAKDSADMFLMMIKELSAVIDYNMQPWIDNIESHRC